MSKIQLLTIIIPVKDRDTGLMATPLCLRIVIDKPTADKLRRYSVQSPIDIIHSEIAGHYSGREIEITGGG